MSKELIWNNTTKTNHIIFVSVFFCRPMHVPGTWLYQDWMSEFSLSELWGNVIIEREHSFLSFLLCFIFYSSVKFVMEMWWQFSRKKIVSVLHFHLSQRKWEAIIAWFPFQLKSCVGQKKSFRNAECLCTILYSILAIWLRMKSMWLKRQCMCYYKKGCASFGLNPQLWYLWYMFIVIIAGSIIGGIPAIIKAGGSIIMHEASHTHDKLAATSDFYEPNLTLFHGF